MQLSWHILIASAFFGGVAILSFAYPARSEEPAKTASAAVRGAKAVDEDLGIVHSARSLLGQVVKNDAGDEFGRIEDLGLDLDRGQVAAVFVLPAKSLPETQSLNVPLSALRWSSPQGPITLSAPAPPSDTTKVVAAPISKPTEVFLIAKQPQIEVKDARGKRVGAIVDFGVSQQQAWIAYAVVALDATSELHERRYPIPLPSFVVTDSAQAWQLDLPAGVLEGTPSFAKGMWPDKVPAAWSEYVHVRYGRSPLGGVERSPKTPPAPNR